MRWTRAWTATAMIAQWCCLGAAAAETAPREIGVTTADGPRAALLVDAGGTSPRPLVLLLHGHMGSAAQALALNHLPSPLAQWRELAEREHIAVVALDGERGADNQRGWNDCRADAANNPTTDDVGFARAVVKQLVDEHRVDPARVYAMGMSNGGMMAFRLALEMPELAAFAVVSASMASRSQCAGQASPYVAALIISGDADPILPYAGGQVHFSNGAPRGGVIAVADAFALWASAHGHTAADASSISLQPQLGGDTTHAEVRFFGASPAQSDVTMVTIAGGGHVEPSIRERYHDFYLHFVGAQSSVFESAEFAWEFFEGKVRRSN